MAMLNNQGYNLHFPMLFLWFSYGFPMVFPLKPPFSYGLNNQMVMGFVESQILPTIVPL